MPIRYEVLRATNADDDRLSRRAVLEVEPQMIVELLKPQGLVVFEVTGDALPADARVIGCYYDYQRDLYHLTLVSRAFAPLGDGYVAPPLRPPSLTRYAGEEAIVRRLREIDLEQAAAALADVT
jgi:hypothetical protein